LEGGFEVFEVPKKLAVRLGVPTEELEFDFFFSFSLKLKGVGSEFGESSSKVPSPESSLS